MNKLEIENGKYQIENNNGIVKVYRHGELWLDGATKFELCLIQRIEELEQQNKRYREALEFYADEEHYKEKLINKAQYDADGICISNDEYAPPIIYFNNGETARKALECKE